MLQRLQDASILANRYAILRMMATFVKVDGKPHVQVTIPLARADLLLDGPAHLDTSINTLTWILNEINQEYDREHKPIPELHARLSRALQEMLNRISMPSKEEVQKVLAPQAANDTESQPQQSHEGEHHDEQHANQDQESVAEGSSSSSDTGAGGEGDRPPHVHSAPVGPSDGM